MAWTSSAISQHLQAFCFTFHPFWLQSHGDFQVIPCGLRLIGALGWLTLPNCHGSFDFSSLDALNFCSRVGGPFSKDWRFQSFTWRNNRENMDFLGKTWIFLQDFLPTNRMKWDLSSGSGKRGLCVDHLPRACGAINMHRQTARSLSEQEELLKVWAKKRSSIFSKTWILWWCWSLHNWYALGTLPTQPTDVQRYQLFNILPFPEKTTMHFFQISNFLGEKRNQTDGFCIGKIWTNATCCFSWHVDGRRTHPVVFMLGTTCHPCTVGLSRDAAAPMIFFGALCVGPGLNFIPTNNGYTYHLVI